MVGPWRYEVRGEKGEVRSKRVEGRPSQPPRGHGVVALSPLTSHFSPLPIYLVASSMNRSISSSVLNTLGEIRAVFSP